jgi:flagellar hook-basal body complex protein FliE
MDAGKAAAIAAYKNQLNMMQQAREATTATMEEPTAGTSFSNILGNALQDAASTVRNTDAVEMQALTGKVDLTDLVTAVSNAELALNTVVTLRDRVIGAYQDIIRMSI